MQPDMQMKDDYECVSYHYERIDIGYIFYVKHVVVWYSSLKYFF
jgi:hypothetical protein